MGCSLILYPGISLAQEFSDVSTDLPQDMKEINLLIERFNDISKSYSNDLEEKIHQLTVLRKAINSERYINEQHQFQYNKLYERTLKFRLNHLKELYKILNNIDNHIDMAIVHSVKNNQKIIYELDNKNWTLELMKQQMEDSTSESTTIAENLQDQIKNIQKDITSSESSLFSNLRTMKINVSSASAEIQTTLIRLEVIYNLVKHENINKNSCLVEH